LFLFPLEFNMATFNVAAEKMFPGKGVSGLFLSCPYDFSYDDVDVKKLIRHTIFFGRK
jgi:hypothetical protein